jgi:hypothetical protein
MDVTVANTILDQLGGANVLSAMLGARNFVAYRKGLMFSLPPGFARNSIRKVEIVLDPSDTYTIQFYKPTKGIPTDYEVVKRVDMIYADQLVEIFERETGLRVKL